MASPAETASSGDRTRPLSTAPRAARSDSLERLIREPGENVPGEEAALVHPSGVEVVGRLGGHRLVLALPLVDERLDPRSERDEHVARSLEGRGARRIALVGDDPCLVVRYGEHLFLRDNHPGK